MITINVTQRDIDHGKIQDCTDCPVALAIRRSVGPLYKVDVIRSIVVISGKVRCLPREVSEFIRRVDAGLPVKPFSFNLGFIP